MANNNFEELLSLIRNDKDVRSAVSSILSPTRKKKKKKKGVKLEAQTPKGMSDYGSIWKRKKRKLSPAMQKKKDAWEAKNPGHRWLLNIPPTEKERQEFSRSQKEFERRPYYHKDLEGLTEKDLMILL